MKIDSTQENATLVVKISGSIDTVTAPELEQYITAKWDTIKELILDFTDVTYISSAGLRVMIVCVQHMEGQGGTFILRNVCDDVHDVFEMTGFSDIITFQ